jgi:hypothetical protein
MLADREGIGAAAFLHAELQRSATHGEKGIEHD